MSRTAHCTAQTTLANSAMTASPQVLTTRPSWALDQRRHGGPPPPRRQRAGFIRSHEAGISRSIRAKERRQPGWLSGTARKEH